jgi:hypothetical protein
VPEPPSAAVDANAVAIRRRHMAKGKEIGAFSPRTVVCTATFLGGGGDSGTFSFTGRAYLDNGDFVTGTAAGTYECAGVNRWKTRAVVHLSDGADVLSEGEIDLAARTWSGKSYEWA